MNMKFNLKGLSNVELAKLFDAMSKTNNKHVAKIIVYRLANRHHTSFEAQLRYLGQRAARRKNYPSFDMVTKLWEERDSNL